MRLEQHLPPKQRSNHLDDFSAHAVLSQFCKTDVLFMFLKARFLLLASEGSALSVSCSFGFTQHGWLATQHALTLALIALHRSQMECVSAQMGTKAHQSWATFQTVGT